MPNSAYLMVVEETLSLLNKNDEWRHRYDEYGKKISANIDFIKIVRRSFREWSPLNIYLNISSAKNAKISVKFELRYLGQTVADIKANMKAGHKLNTRHYEKANLRDFDCEICLSNADWQGNDAAKFRSFFKYREGVRKLESKRKNDEHRLESLLITEFSKTANKGLRHIKPVKIGGVRFPMPTPISASNHKAIKYSREKGGGIDILARTGIGGKATHLCILELKDENKKSEPPKDALKQAVAYATFIRELLRSDVGVIWWKLFGFSGKIPETLELYAACAMPSGYENDYSFGNMELNIDNDMIKLHYLYFAEENNKISIKPGDTSLAVTG